MKISYESGPKDARCVVFVHGAGMAGWMWKKQLDSVASLRTIVVDLPDHGLDRATPFMSIESVADELAALVSERCPEGKACLVGHSLGAKVVLEMLARHPECAASAVVSSALVRPSPLVAMMNSHALNKLSLWMLGSNWLARCQAKMFKFPDPDMTEHYLADIRSMRTENLDRPVSAFASRLYLPQGLDAIQCPVLVTAGSRETRSMLDSAREIQNAIAGAKLEILDEADHTYPWSAFKAYNRLLESWLR
jgi:pimeloyl-ACP methyl ester carboxylesterase